VVTSGAHAIFGATLALSQPLLDSRAAIPHLATYDRPGWADAGSLPTIDSARRDFERLSELGL